MIAACPVAASGPGFLAGTLRSLDCQSLSVAERSFAFLSGPGGAGLTFLSIAVTLAIALFAFRLMFGGEPGFGDATGAIVRIGIALAIATSWPAVSSVIAEPLLKGPAELTRWTGLSTALPERLGRLDDGIGALTSWGTGRGDLAAQRTASGDYTSNEAATVALSDAIAFGAGRTAFLVGSIAGVGFLGLASAVLIGLAPMFAGLLLFERTRGIFAGWARLLFALLIAGAAVRLVLGIELALLEPWLGAAIEARRSGLATPSVGQELVGMTLAFGAMIAALTLVILRAILALEIPSIQAILRSAEARRETQREATTTLPGPQGAPVPGSAPGRTLQTLEALRRIDSHRSHERSDVTRALTGPATDQPGTASRGPDRGSSRRQGRATLAAARRDARQ
jgi:type IV secretion system protein VirB6